MTRSVCYRQFSLPSFSCHYLCKNCSNHLLSDQHYKGINLNHNLFPFSLSRKVQFCALNVRWNFTEAACRLLYPTEKIITTSEEALGLLVRDQILSNKMIFSFSQFE